MKTIAFIVSGAALATSAGAVELTEETWDAAVAGKSVFVKFQAPWCGHCTSMKPAWDQLSAEFKDSKTAVVADVDCTAEEELCETHGVRGFPTIKHGDPNNLEEYTGGRDFDSLKKFAEENIGPTCGPANLELCSDDKKALIEKFSKMSASDLEHAIKEKRLANEQKDKDIIEKLETDFRALAEGLAKDGPAYTEANELKDKDVEAIKNSGLGLMKAVSAHQKAGKSEL